MHRLYMDFCTREQASRRVIASLPLAPSTSHSVLSSDFHHHCSTKLLHPSSADENNPVLFYIVVVNFSIESGCPFVSVADSTSPQSRQLFMQQILPGCVSCCARHRSRSAWLRQSCSRRRSLLLLNDCVGRVSSSTCLNLSVRHSPGHITHLPIIPRRNLSSQGSRLLYTTWAGGLSRKRCTSPLLTNLTEEPRLQSYDDGSRRHPTPRSKPRWLPASQVDCITRGSEVPAATHGLQN